MRLTSLLAAAVVCLAAGCATLPEDPEERAEIEALNDPLEPTNRAIFDANMALDDAVMVPVAESYRDTLPDWLREGIHNVLSNLQEPYVAGNDLLQGNPHAAADSLGRFLINSTFGLLGARDAVAESGGAKPHKTDIGITLAVWGFEDGPYLMLPFFGPSSLRDGAGKVAEYWASPTGAMLESAGVGVISDVQTGVDLLDTRAALLDPLNELRRTSLDEYAAIRSLYRQSRAAALAEARAGQISSRAPVAGVAAPVPATPESPATPTAAGTGAASGGGAGGAGAAPARVEASAPLPDDGGRGRIEFVDHQPAPAPESAAAPVSKSKTKKH